MVVVVVGSSGSGSVDDRGMIELQCVDIDKQIRNELKFKAVISKQKPRKGIDQRCSPKESKKSYLMNFRCSFTGTKYSSYGSPMSTSVSFLTGRAVAPFL